MRKFVTSSLFLTLLLGSLNASADLYFFSYTFDGIVPTGSGTAGRPGTVITGIVDGDLQGDEDTIAINSLKSATLSGFDYDRSSSIGIRGHVPGSRAKISLSGNTLDIWVCVNGFTIQTNNGGDCSFGQEGGFLINNVAGDLGLLNFPGLSGRPGVVQTIGWAGIPELDAIAGGRYREGDIPLNPNNWFAALVDGDGDGVSDDNDICPNSNLEESVVVLEFDTGVENIVFGETGCSTGDLVEGVIVDCTSAIANGKVSSCATHGFNSLKSIGVITGREKGALQSAIARSRGGKKK